MLTINLRPRIHGRPSADAADEPELLEEGVALAREVPQVTVHLPTGPHQHDHLELDGEALAGAKVY